MVLDPPRQVGNYPEVTCSDIYYRQTSSSDVVRFHGPRTDGNIDTSQFVFPGAPDFKPLWAFSLGFLQARTISESEKIRCSVLDDCLFIIEQLK